MAIEIVDFPINSMVIFHSYVSLPEGRWYHIAFLWKIGPGRSIDFKSLLWRWMTCEEKELDVKWSNFKTHVKQKSCFDTIYSEQVFDGFCWFQRWLFPEQTFVCSVHWSLLMYQCRSIVCRTFLLELNVYFFVCRTLVEMPYVIPQYVQINNINMCCFFSNKVLLKFYDLSIYHNCSIEIMFLEYLHHLSTWRQLLFFPSTMRNKAAGSVPHAIINSDSYLTMEDHHF